jgi:hypothetical protein
MRQLPLAVSYWLSTSAILAWQPLPLLEATQSETRCANLSLKEEMGV